MLFWGPALSWRVLWDGPERGESGGKMTSSVTLRKGAPVGTGRGTQSGTGRLYCRESRQLLPEVI